MAVVRDCRTIEEKYYRIAVENRDEEMYRQVHKRFPGVLWGNIFNTLSLEDQKWVGGLLEIPASNISNPSMFGLDDPDYD